MIDLDCRCWQRIHKLLVAWWRADRVRISPREGLLLRLEPPCTLGVCGQRIYIIQRHLTADASVRYRCLTEQGDATLVVGVLDQSGTLHLHWQTTEQSVHLSVADIDIYG